ncbi:hypothetical protein [Helicobacter sp. 12S02634-8]|uniref:hypothetical protein n=1 Tax=Helicobacter sp. 12S02634-8 TaxID=1476199 RepID=UPI001C0EAFC2|nr:hypothetical protein [Helicobacter sp. 12S02634-8]
MISPATITFANTTATGNKLTLNNAQGTLKLEGLKANTATGSDTANGIALALGSSLVSSSTTIIGNLYFANNNSIKVGKDQGVYYNLSFDTTKQSKANNGVGNYLQTNYIGLGVGASSLSATGLGSLRSMDKTNGNTENGQTNASTGYDPATKTDTGVITLATLDGGPSNVGTINLNNTGATLALSPSYSGVTTALNANQKAINNSGIAAWNIFNDFDIRGTSLTGTANTTITDLNYSFYGKTADNSGFTMVFAKSTDNKGLATIVPNPSNTTNSDNTESTTENKNFDITNAAIADTIKTNSTNNQTYGQNAYVASSSFAIGQFLTTSKLDLTFIGADSIGEYSSTIAANKVTKVASSNTGSFYSFINAGTLTTATPTNGSTGNTDTNTPNQILAAFTNIDNYGELRLLGTNLVDADFSNSKLNKLNLQFDNRDANGEESNTDNGYATYKDANGNTIDVTTNAFGALSDSILKVNKSSLNGEVKLGAINSNVVLTGTGSLGKNAKITGTSTSGQIILRNGTFTFSKNYQTQANSGSAGANGGGSNGDSSLTPADVKTSDIISYNNYVYIDNATIVADKFDGFGYAKIYSPQLKAYGVSTNNVAVFYNKDSSQTLSTDLTRVGNYNYTGFSNNANALYGNIATALTTIPDKDGKSSPAPLTITFIGNKSTGFGVAKPTADSGNGNTTINYTALGSSLANTTINLIDTGSVLAANISGVNTTPAPAPTEGATNGNTSTAQDSTPLAPQVPNNTLNFYGNTGITPTEVASSDSDGSKKPTLDIQSSNLKIVATINQANASYWGGKTAAQLAAEAQKANALKAEENSKTPENGTETSGTDVQADQADSKAQTSGTAAQSTPSVPSAENALTSAALAAADTSNNAQVSENTTESTPSGYVINFDIGSKDASKSTAVYDITFDGGYAYPDFENSFYTGTIHKLNDLSTFTFKKVGSINSAQIANTLAHIVLDQSIIKGDFLQTNATIDFRPIADSEKYAQGIDALTGNIVMTQAEKDGSLAKNIFFDFTGNTRNDKIGSSETNKTYYVAGNAGSTFNFINLTKIVPTSDTKAPNNTIYWDGDSTTSNGTDALFKTLQDNGVHLRAASSSDKFGEVSQNLADDAHFNFYGSNIYGYSDQTQGGSTRHDGKIESKYGIGIYVDSRADGSRLKIGGLNSELNKSSLYNVSEIKSTKGGVSLGLYGNDALASTEKTIKVSIAGDDKVFNLIGAGEPITSTNADGSPSTTNPLVADITLEGNSTNGTLKAGSVLDIANISFKGSFLTSKDSTASGSNQGGFIKAIFDDTAKLGEGSYIGSKDGSVNVTINNSTPPTNTTDTSKASTFIIGSGVSTLKFTNAGVIKLATSDKTIVDKIDSQTSSDGSTTVATNTDTTTTSSATQTLWNKTSEGTKFAKNSNVQSSGTTIIGNFYTDNGDSLKGSASGTFFKLSFDTTDSNNASYFQTNMIGLGVNGSSLSAVGLHSLRSLDKTSDSGSTGWDNTTQKDTGVITLKLHDGNTNPMNLMNVNLVNTGANVAIDTSYTGGKTQYSDVGSWNMYNNFYTRGTSITGDATSNSFYGTGPNTIKMIFAKSTDTFKELYTTLKQQGDTYNLSLNSDKIASITKPTPATEGDTENKDTTDTTNKDGTTPTPPETYGQNGYIAESQYSLGELKINGGVELTFIGNQALSPDYADTMAQDKVTAILSTNSNSLFSFINAGTLTTNTAETTASINKSLAAFNQTGGNGTIRLLGTTIKDADLSKSNLGLSAIFDQRNADGVTKGASGDTDNNKPHDYEFVRIKDDKGQVTNLTTDAFGTLSGSILNVNKSSLDGTITLGDNAKASYIAFLGKDALGANGKLMGGNANTNAFFDGAGTFKSTTTGETTTLTEEASTFKLDPIKGFKGNASYINTSVTSALEDKAGVTITYDPTTGEGTPTITATPSVPSNSSENSGTSSPTSPSSSTPSVDGSSSTPTYADSDKSNFNRLTITFNDDKHTLETLEKTENTDGKTESNATENSGTENTDTQTEGGKTQADSKIELSTAAKDFVNNLQSFNGTTYGINLDKANTMSQSVGYTNGAMTLNFIGKDSLVAGYDKTTKDDGSISYTKKSDGTGLVIANDNKNNVYNFIDFGKIDIGLFAGDNGVFNGSIGWIGNSFQVGTIRNALGTQENYQVIDFNNLPDPEVAQNIYQAQMGAQYIIFDFHGSTKADDSTQTGIKAYKFQGQINESSYSKDSAYIFKDLGTLTLANNTSTEKHQEFADALNAFINEENKTTTDGSTTYKNITINKGTIGITDTKVIGNIIANKVKDNTQGGGSSAGGSSGEGSSSAESGGSAEVKYSKDIALNLTFSDSAHNDRGIDASLTGNLIEGDATKTITFLGQNSFNKDLVIKGGDVASSYSFFDAGVLSQDQINNILYAGATTPTDSAEEKKEKINEGTFAFDGATAIYGDLNNTSAEAKNQSILLGNQSSGVLLAGNTSKGGLSGLSDISTTALVNAKIGVGSRVAIVNKNANSVYDFSSFAKSAPVIADINLNTATTDLTKEGVSADGITKAQIKGFGGNTSLIGAINDSSQTITKTQTTTPTARSGDTPTTQTTTQYVASSNAYVFGDYASNKTATWVLTGDSTIEYLFVYNKDANQRNAILDTATFAQNGSVIDLRGNRAMGNTEAMGGAALNGAILANAGLSAPTGFTPHTLTAKNADLDQAVFRLGVDTITSQSDKLVIDGIGNIQEAMAGIAGDTSQKGVDRQTNLLQVFVDRGDGTITSPILLATINNTQNSKAVNAGYFQAVGYSLGLYRYVPVVKATASVVTDKTDTTDKTQSEGSATAITGATTDTSTTTKDDNTINGTAVLNPNDKSQTLYYYLTAMNISKDSGAIKPLEQSLGAFYRGFRIATNNLNLRMGELRGIGAQDGVWARIINGAGSDKYSNQDYYTTLQAGYDKKFDVSGGVNYLGVSAEATLISSKGGGYTSTGRNLGLGLYNTYIMDNGFYVDASMKYLNLGNRISFNDANLQRLSSANSVYSNAFLLGGEVGYRYEIDKLLSGNSNPYTKGYYIEPQAELIYGYIQGANYNASINSALVEAKLKGDNAFISRVGAVFGKHFKSQTGVRTDLRLGLSYINEINSGGSSTLVQTGANTLANPDINATTLANNKLNVSLGVNVVIDENWRVYADLSRTFFGVYNFDYNANIGARMSFGQKASKLERSLQNKQQESFQPKQEPIKAQTKAEVLKDKQTISFTQAQKEGKKTGCQGCFPEKGLYLQVAVLTQNDPKATSLIDKSSYRVYDFMFENKDAKRYLMGPFKNIDTLIENKPQADKIVQDIDNNPKSYAVMYEVK